MNPYDQTLQNVASANPYDSTVKRLYHGTPHTFAPASGNPLGEFDHSRMGSGEGNQAFGWGTYLAEQPRVANSYVNAGQYIDPTKVKYMGRSIQHHYETAQRNHDRASRLSVNDPAYQGANAAHALWEKMMTHGHPQSVINDALADPDDWPELTKVAKSIDLNKFTDLPRGNLYHVEIPEHHVERMLDWDKAWKDQPEYVKHALKSSGVFKRYKENLSDYSTPMGTRNKEMRGGNIYAFLEHEQKGDRAASEHLKSLGVPGLKFLDAFSRDAKRGTRNFVLFDPSIAKIVERE